MLRGYKATLLQAYRAFGKGRHCRGNANVNEPTACFAAPVFPFDPTSCEPDFLATGLPSAPLAFQPDKKGSKWSEPTGIPWCWSKGRQGGQFANRDDGTAFRQSVFRDLATLIRAADSGHNSISQQFGAYAAKKVTQLLLLLTVSLNFLRDNRNFSIEPWFNYCPYENDKQLVERRLFR
jgi:hypothetical protein